MIKDDLLEQYQQKRLEFTQTFVNVTLQTHKVKDITPLSWLVFWGTVGFLVFTVYSRNVTLQPYCVPYVGTGTIQDPILGKPKCDNQKQA